MVQSCCVEGCKSEWSPVSDISLFSFPLNNEQLLQKWKEEIPTKCKITKNTRICSMHFDGDALEERFGKRKLKKSAVPTLFAAKEFAKYRNEINNTATKVLIVLTPIQDKIQVTESPPINLDNINENGSTENSLDKIEISEITNELNDTTRNVSTPLQEKIDLQDSLYDDFYNENSCSENTLDKIEIAEIDNVVNDVARNILSPKQEIIEMQDPLRINFDNENENANIENPLLETFKVNNSINDSSTNVFQSIQEKMDIQDPLYFDKNENSGDSLFKKIDISTINNLVDNTPRNVFIVLPQIQERMDINFDNGDNNMNIENSIRKVETKEVSTQVDPNHIPYSDRERAMRRKIKNLEAQLKRRDEKINKISQLIKELKKSGNMTEELEEVLIKRFEGFNLELFINELKKSKTSKKYTHKMKEFASTLYFYSPKGYNYVRSKLNLPHETILRKWIGQCSCKVDFLSGALIFSENELLKSDVTEDITL